jgi:lipoprotein-anchoring transpeptidase ErfK/SrfK
MALLAFRFEGVEGSMTIRLLAGLMVAVATLIGAPEPAKADTMSEEILTGGAPRGRFPGSLWGGSGGGYSPIRRTTVSYTGREAPGTIVINTSERRLYLVLGNGEALRYGIGVGRVGFTWAGVTRVVAKKEWPDWTPPPQMLRRRPDLPRFMKGGPDNPLGARAMYLGSSLYRIHGSNEPETIGTAVSSGCFRLTNDDVIDLYGRVRVGTKVIVVR